MANIDLYDLLARILGLETASNDGDTFRGSLIFSTPDFSQLKELCKSIPR
jgi:hypothetical protein